MKRFCLRITVVTLVLIIFGTGVLAQRRVSRSVSDDLRTSTVITEPNAIVWRDEIGALAKIEAARHARSVYPEASAVEGRIYRESAQIDEAIGAFNRAIRESHGFQPEAHVGLGRVYEDKGQYELAAREFEIALDQLADTEPIIYQLLGAAYEKGGNNSSAVAAYENYLRLAPNGSLAPAVRSIVEQLKSQSPD